MAFAANTTQQLSLTDSTFQLTERETRFLEKSWAKAFADKIFPAIDESIFSVLYSDKASRPNTPVNVIIGALILKEAFGDTDEEVMEALMFDLRYQYALHTTSCKEQPLSDRTLSRFRARCLAYETENGIDLIHKCITGMAEELAEFMNITPQMRRMDSIMVAANIKNLSVLELFYTCAANLAKVMEQRKVSVPERLRHYLEKDDTNQYLYHKKEGSIEEKILTIMREAETLISLCDATGVFDDTSEYQLLIRLMKERTIMDDDGKRRLRRKEEIEEPSKTLPNPSDPEATFRSKGGKKHIGYVGNVVEGVGEKGSLVMDYAYEQNLYSDSQFLKDYLAGQPVYEEEVTTVADGAYGGEGNRKEAAKHNIKLITTNLTGNRPDEIYADFEFTQDGKQLLKCIHGQVPLKCTYNGRSERSGACFPIQACQNCPYRDRCRPRMFKNTALKEICWKTAERAKQIRYMRTEEFRKYSCFRNGVETIPSLLRRKYHVDKIPAHGTKRTRLHFGFKIGALNFQKLLTYIDRVERCALQKETA